MSSEKAVGLVNEGVRPGEESESWSCHRFQQVSWKTGGVVENEDAMLLLEMRRARA